MKPGYRMPVNPVTKGGDIIGDTTPITGLNVKSLITHPQDGMKVKASHAVQISGVAWAGEADITAVEISEDAGRTWQQTQLGRDQSKYAWRLWQYVWRPAQPGEYTLMARASDNKGCTQPDDPRWNPSGYLWNGIQRVRVHVES